MAVVPITIQGMAYPRDKSQDPFPVTIVGFGWITGLQVGGGPMPGGPGEGGKPPGTWGGAGEPMPTPPIVIPPDRPGEPPTIWGPNDPRPGQGPIIPPDEAEPPPDHPLEEMLTLVAKEPPAGGGWGWFPEYGWVYSRGEGESQPKRGGKR